MKINYLEKRFTDEKILYAPELELESTPAVQEKCYPAMGCLPSDPVGNYRFFYLLISEIGEYEEYENHPTRNFIVSEWRRDNIEARLQKMYEKQNRPAGSR
jgi:hypothetical protein